MKNTQKSNLKLGQLVLGAITIALPLSTMASTVEAREPSGTNILSTFADVNGDGKADYCKLYKQGTFGGSEVGQIFCRLTEGSNLSNLREVNEFISPQIDFGSPSLRVFADVNGDKKADFCRIVGTVPSQIYLSCHLAGFGKYGFQFALFSDTEGVFKSPLGIDLGYANYYRGFSDVNGDGKADYCRVVGFGDAFHMHLGCNLAGATGFKPTQEVQSLPGVF
jgi:hypothetical protein